MLFARRRRPVCTTLPNVKSNWHGIVNRKLTTSLFQKLINAYLERCGPDVAVKSKFVIAVYKEKIRSSSGVINDSVGNMMCEEQYMVWAATLDGGKNSANAAKSEWDNMVANKKDHIHDELGPEDQKLRFRVNVEDLVILRNAYMRDKELQMSKAAVKDLDEGKFG